jgi:hypothetical protein
MTLPCLTIIWYVILLLYYASDKYLLTILPKRLLLTVETYCSRLESNFRRSAVAFTAYDIPTSYSLNT